MADDTSQKKVWLVTGAGRGMGVDIAQAALAAGYAVVATGRDPERVSAAVGAHDDLLTVALDVTDPASAPGRGQAAVDRFGRIDVLVNNAGNFFAGFFEEITPEDFRAQVETNLFGPLNVTRAVLPVMRAQRSGLVVTMSSSTAGLIGQEFTSAYAAAKFALEGWMESLAPEVAPFGIRTMVVEPGFFRTDLLTPESTSYAEPSIEDYAERTKQTVAAWNGMNGLQGGDPAKLATALVQLAGSRGAAAALGRRRRRRRGRRAEGEGPARPGRRPPRAVVVAGPRGRVMVGVSGRASLTPAVGQIGTPGCVADQGVSIHVDQPLLGRREAHIRHRGPRGHLAARRRACRSDDDGQC